MDKETLLIGTGFILIGGFVIAIATYSLLRTRRFVAEAVHARGEVIALRAMGGSKVTYAPVVRFTPLGGRPLEFTDEVSSNPPGYRVGDQVEVLYRPHNPSDARLASLMRLYGHEVIFIAFSSLFVAIGSVMLFFTAFG